MDKIRLDKALLNQISSRAKAQDMIKEGKISANGKVITKASFLVGDEDDIVVTHTEDEFVSRGAFKLKGCLDKYNVNIQNQVVLDIGASTGGFTDVCLRYGAKKVYALDVKWKGTTLVKLYQNGLMNRLILCAWMLVLYLVRPYWNMYYVFYPFAILRYL